MRVAHCSDLHLLSHDGARWLDLANKRWIGAMNLIGTRSRHYHVDAFNHMIEDMNEQGIEHVLCTGDVTNLALEQEFRFARAMFDRLVRGPANVTVIPGNHDAYVAEGVGHFSTIFDAYHQTDPGWEWPASADPADDTHWPIVRVRDELAIIGLSTSRQTPWFTAYGRIGEGQLDRLRQALSDPRLAHKARLVAIHHPPAGRRAMNKIRGLKDHAPFAAILAEHGADLVLHGHEHQDLTESLPGPLGVIPVRGIASGTYHHNKVDRIARYRVFEIEHGKFVRDYVRVWTRDAGRFEAHSGMDQQSNYVS